MSRFTIILLIIFATSGYSQESRKLTLKEVINIARGQSPASLRAETRKENRYWQFRTYQSNYYPQLRLDGTFPDFNRQFAQIVQPDGSIEPRLISQNNSNITLGLRQTVALTGGQVFMSSRVDRFDDFLTDQTKYNGLPLSIGFVQPLFSFNDLKWDKKIEPLRYEESKRAYAEDLEQISSTSTQLFFDLLLAQISLNIAQINVQSNDTIYQIAQGRYRLGNIPENELLNLELNLMNSRQAVAQAELDLETSTLLLKSFLGFTDSENIELIIPDEIPQFPVDPDKAIEEAQKNRQEAIEYKRLQLEAEAALAQAKGETGLNANLFASFGFSGTGLEFRDMYNNPDDQQRLTVGFSIPVVDWGRTKSRIRTAEANQKLVDYTVEQDRVNFEQEVFTQVKQFEMLRKQVEITRVADDISQRRYNIAKNRYLIGKISITDLSLALTQKDEAKRSYISALRNFWSAYYNLRRLTLYDFETDSLLYIPEE